MQRRDFVKAFTSLMGVSSLGLSAGLRAAPSDFSNQKKWLFVMAEGGWDPTSFCDPKGQVEASAGKGVVNNYPASFIAKAGNINFVPALTEAQAPNFHLFFEKYYQELLVVNGVNMNTNNHEAGQQLCISGDARFGQINFPSAYALQLPGGERPPLAYVEGGGYSNTGGLLSKTRTNALSSITGLTEPQKIGTADIIPKALFDKVIAARNARLDRLQAASTLPAEQKGLSNFELQRISSSDLKALNANVPSVLNANGRFKEIQYLLASMKTGLTISGQVEVAAGFDTHGDHDAKQYESLKKLFETLDFILQEAERQGLRSLLNIAVVSDFGREPWYNTDAGKDHWANTSMMFIGPDVKGNRVVGGTDAQVKGRKINHQTLALDDVNGTPLNVADIHASLREISGIKNSALDKSFPVNGIALKNLFSG
jgi:Protein of unknown function (DUF1501)